MVHLSKDHTAAMSRWVLAQANEASGYTVLKHALGVKEGEIQENRSYLSDIIDVLFYTAQQGSAQRGHEECRTNLSSRSDTNRGNFLELLSLVGRFKPELAARLETRVAKHTAWISPRIQNELLEIMRELTIEQVSFTY